MIEAATLTSKRQLTIPSRIFKRLGLKEGERLLVSEAEGGIRIESALSHLKKLAGSVAVPERFKGMGADKIVEKSKEEYFLKSR